MRAIALRALPWLLLAAAVVGAAIGFRAHCIGIGELRERARWQQLEAQRDRDAAATYAENVRLGNRAAAAAADQVDAERSFSTTLQMERRHARLVTPVVCPARPVIDGAGRRAAGVDGAAPSAAAGEPPPTGDAADDGRPRARLTADAVRMWNSALAGRDVPAGACGAAADAGGACAADAGLTVDDAWDNAAANALSCRIDRARHRALIRYLTNSVER